MYIVSINIYLNNLLPWSGMSVDSQSPGKWLVSILKHQDKVRNTISLDAYAELVSSPRLHSFSILPSEEGNRASVRTLVASKASNTEQRPNICQKSIRLRLLKCFNFGPQFDGPSLNSVALVRKRTIPTDQPPLVGKVSANFCG
jgi:hypothetical protein